MPAAVTPLLQPGRMSRKLDDKSDTVRMLLVTTRAQIESVEEWRVTQKPVPNVSAAIRQLIELGLKASGKP